MEKKIYKYDLGNIFINFSVNFKKSEAFMEDYYYEPKYIKLFLLTLKKAIDDLKIGNVKKIIQKVNISDWNQFLKKDNNWKMIEENKYYDYCLIECDIEQVYYCMLKGLGIYEYHTEYKTIHDL